jgi:hypothetical protein
MVAYQPHCVSTIHVVYPEMMDTMYTCAAWKFTCGPALRADEMEALPISGMAMQSLDVMKISVANAISSGRDVGTIVAGQEEGRHSSGPSQLC